jgi:DNA-binding transcriptional MerR regulator
MAKGASENGEMTIRELAERTGMTVRNIRAHQARGLLPPPVVRGRTGFYDDRHLARIELTREMQADGLNLEAIRRVLESSDGAAGQIFDFTRAIRVPFEEETPEIYGADELAETWGAERLNPKLVAHGEKLGILRQLPDGRIEVTSPRMQEAAVELAQLGIGAEAAMGVADKLRRHAEGSARAFVDLFVKEVWEPFDKAGRPDADWPRIREALERMRPLASTTVLAVFQIAMDEAMEKASEQTLRQEAAKTPKERKQQRRRKRR